jgi:Flp pilus assembly protein TadD
MKPARHVTALVLTAALATVACSKDEKPVKGTTSTSESPKPLPVLPSVLSNQSDPQPSAGAKLAPAVQPSTFADGKAAYDARKYGEATAIFQAYAERRPENPWGHYMLGLSAWKSGDLVKAEDAFERALEIDPRHVKSYVNLSRVLIDLKRSDDAIATLTKAAEIHQDAPEVWRLLGRTYHAQHKTEQAVAAYRRAIEADDADAWAINNLGLVLLESGRPEEALPLFATAAQLRKDVPAFHNNLGMALEHTGRFRAAALAYASALTTDPGYGKAKQNLARVEAVKGGHEEPFEPLIAEVSSDEPKADDATVPAIHTASR